MNKSDLCLEWKELGRGNKTGLHKRWIYKDEPTRQIVGDYLQKINFSVQDINEVLRDISYNNKNIVFLVTAVDWIVESVHQISDSFSKNILNGFAFTRKNEYELAYKYLKAMRSFLVAHPLKTEKHSDFSFDGRYICMDVIQCDNSTINMLWHKEECFRYINHEGMFTGHSQKSDFYLHCYSSDFYENKYNVYVGIKLNDILEVARLAIKKVYELDIFFSKLKRKDFVETIPLNHLMKMRGGKI